MSTQNSYPNISQQLRHHDKGPAWPPPSPKVKSRRTEQTIKVPPNANGKEIMLAKMWEQYRDLLNGYAHRFQIDPAVTAAVLLSESHTDPFAADGRLIIRFESQLFYSYWGKRNPNKFQRYFYFSPKGSWKAEHWRANRDSLWQPVHQNQTSEWNAFNIARRLDERSALLSTRMGLAQIMGFNYKRMGFSSPLEMFADFQRSTEQQIDGFFRFIASHRLIPFLQTRNFLRFAISYNGPEHATNFAKLIQANVSSFETLIAQPSALAQGAQRIGGHRHAYELEWETLELAKSPELAADTTVERPSNSTQDLAATDTQRPAVDSNAIPPVLDEGSAASLLQREFAKREEIFSEMRRMNRHPYRIAIWQHQILLGVTILCLLCAAWLGFKTQSGKALALGLIGLGALLIAVVSRPHQQIEAHLRSTTGLSVIYSNYWARLPHAFEHGNVAEIERISQEALRDIQLLSSTKRLSK